MQLIEGSYEHLITDALQDEITQAESKGLVCRKKEIKDTDPEAPALFADHVARLLRNRLKDQMTEKERCALANRIIDLLAETNDEVDSDGIRAELVADAGHLLTDVMSQQHDATLRQEGRVPIRPQSGFRVSCLFTGGDSKLSLSEEIVRDIDSADRISLIVSFLKLSGLNLLYDRLKAFCQHEGHSLRIITTTYCGITEAKAIERLAALPHTEIRISYQTKIERLHAKAYIFERRSGMDTAYIGSSNLSRSAQTDGLEWNVRVTNVENAHLIKTALATFNQYWNSPNFEDFSLGGIERFREQMHLDRTPQSSTTRLTAYHLLPQQKQILDRIAAVRAQGLYRNLIVAATGTGKTVISAFDYLRYRQQHPSANHRLLFIAHREEILRQALYTYRCVLNDANFAGLWVGEERPARADGDLFVSVQTFRSRYNEFFCKLPTNHYAYLVIDEAHHITASSYRQILDHFAAPALLVGLTATPERMDGQSLLPDFGGQISAELRLPQALDEGLLTPFQYLCISDSITDLRGRDLMDGTKYNAARILPKLCTYQRVDLILDRLRYYLPDEHRCRALCFCALKEHASFMADELCKRGLRAKALTSDNDTERQQLCHQLSEGSINYLCVVDMFNEGIDIPAVDTVLFLRPTDSLTIFLQQLGRGLRLSPGKDLLTVFDFVSQLNGNYDYASRLRALMRHADVNLEKEVRNGFTLLPRGCTIHMEELAQQYVIDNIKAAIYNVHRITRELQACSEMPRLADFAIRTGDIRQLYKKGHCWTELKRRAGLIDYEEDKVTKCLTKNIGRLCHVNTIGYLRFINRVMQAVGSLSPESFSETERTYALMLYYALFQAPITMLGTTDIYEALGRLKNYPYFVSEVIELTDYLISQLDTVTRPVGHGLPSALELYGCYSREEITIIMGLQTANKMVRTQEGVVNFPQYERTEGLFVTLNKSEADFSPTTLYDDYVMGEHAFHMQSQNRDSHEGRGSRYVRQKEEGRRFLLFVREHKTDGFGNTSSFHCFGLVDYVSSYGDRPMNIEWHVAEPIMPRYLKSV